MDSAYFLLSDKFDVFITVTMFRSKFFEIQSPLKMLLYSHSYNRFGIVFYNLHNYYNYFLTILSAQLTYFILFILILAFFILSFIFFNIEFIVAFSLFASLSYDVAFVL